MDRSITLHAEPDGYFSGLAPQLRTGDRYWYRLDGRARLLPDPASRFQPDGPHGPSQIVDPAGFRWSDDDWRGIAPQGQILYEMHVGTFTPEGIWVAAAQHLPALAELGITVIEMMPVAEFPGRFGWGYDGVDLFAPTRLYGTPDDLRAFIDRAHAAGLAVIHDVVYNHLGPDGNYLDCFSPAYFTDLYENEWGEAINFDGPDAGPVRAFFIANAVYWITEFHFDGLRLDATQQIFDCSPHHILAEITERTRAAAPGRQLYFVAENEPQQVKLLDPPERGGYGIDAMWNDDFHHSAIVATTGRNEAYYSDHLGGAQEFVSAAKYGFLYQGQRYSWQKKPRGTPALDRPPESFVCFLQNHDQVANSARGARLHALTSPSRYRAMTALLLLAPWTPMLFQGEEFAASTPFLYFADHKPDLAGPVRRGRAKFLAQFSSLALPETQEVLADPEAPDTFARCKLDWSERDSHTEATALHRDLIRLRREDPVLSVQRRGVVDGAVLGPEAFVLRWIVGAEDRLLLVNLGSDLPLVPSPEPLLAPPAGRRWAMLWSSEDVVYGGMGAVPPCDAAGAWRLPGRAAVAMAAVEAPPAGDECTAEDRDEDADRGENGDEETAP